MATVIDMPSPLATGVNAGNSLLGGYNDAKEKALALARQKMLDDREQSNADRTYNAGRSDESTRVSEWQQSEANTEKVAAHTMAHEDAADKIAKQAADDAHRLAPVMADYYRKLNKGLDATAELDKVKLYVAKLDAKDKARVIQEAHALAAAQLAHENAMTTQSYAAAARDRIEGQRGPKPTTDDLKMAALQARDALPPALQGMLDQVESGQTNRVGLLTWAKGNPQYAPYVPILAKLLTIPGTVGRASAADTRATNAANASARDDTGAMAPKALALKASKLMPQSGLPESIQSGIIAELAKGVSSDAIRQKIDGAVDKDTKAPSYDAATLAKVDAFMRTLDPANNPAAAATPQGGGFDLGQMFQNMLQGH